MHRTDRVRIVLFALFIVAVLIAVMYTSTHAQDETTTGGGGEFPGGGPEDNFGGDYDPFYDGDMIAITPADDTQSHAIRSQSDSQLRFPKTVLAGCVFVGVVDVQTPKEHASVPQGSRIFLDVAVLPDQDNQYGRPMKDVTLVVRSGGGCTNAVAARLENEIGTSWANFFVHLGLDKRVDLIVQDGVIRQVRSVITTRDF